VSLLITNSVASDLKFIQEDAQHGFRNGSALLTAPLHFKRQDWRNIGLTLAGTILFFSIDKPIQILALNNQNSLNDCLFNLDKIHGNEYDLYFAGAIYGFGLVSNEEHIRRIGLNAAEAYLFSGAITGIGKVVFGRRRPYAGDSPLFFSPFHFLENRFHSLPSGHNTVSFAVSTVMAKSWDNVIWKVFWYGNAGLVAASRVYHNQHWFSDTFLGTVIGYSVANYILNSDVEKNSRKRFFIKVNG